MSEGTLEKRIETLEKQMAEVLTTVGDASSQPPRDAWLETIGMFENDPVMKDIQEEGLKIREADRKQAGNGDRS